MFYLLAAWTVGSIAATAQAGTSNAETPGYRLQIARLTDRVHVISQAEPFHVQPIGNVTVIEQESGLVLVDAGGTPASGERISRLVRSVSKKPVRAIVLTHWHPDHVLGVQALLRHWPKASVVATAQTRGHLLGESMAMYPRADDPARETALQKNLRGTIERLERASADPTLTAEERAGFKQTSKNVRAHAAALSGVRVVAPTSIIGSRARLEDAIAPVEILAADPANTDGDALVWLPRQRVIATGDVVVAPVPFGFDAHPASWRAVLQRVKRMDFRYLVPGHGAPQPDSSYLDRLSNYLSEVIERVHPLRSSALSAEQLAARVDLSGQIRSIAGKHSWLRRWAQSYWAAPIIKSAIAEGQSK